MFLKSENHFVLRLSILLIKNSEGIPKNVNTTTTGIIKKE
jgi:hypothetical protein